MQPIVDDGSVITWHSLNGAVKHIDDGKPFLIFVSSNDCASCDASMHAIESLDVAEFVEATFVSIISNVDHDGVVIADAPLIAIMSYDKAKKKFVVSSTFDGVPDSKMIMTYLEYGLALYKMQTAR